MAKKDWWKSYFRDGWESIQHLVKKPHNTKQEANFIAAIMRRLDYKSVLDVPSGAGRIALELSRRGYQTCGIEYNPDAVALATEKAAKRKLQDLTNFRVGDMRQMSFKDEFDMAVCVFNSFGYFDDADNLLFLKGIANALKPGGAFLLDCHILESLIPVWSEKGFWRFENHILFEEREWDIKNSRMNGRWTFIYPNGEQKCFESSVRVYGCKELSDIMAQLGFKPPKIFSNYNAEAFELGNDGAILLFKKAK